MGYQKFRSLSDPLQGRQCELRAVGETLGRISRVTQHKLRPTLPPMPCRDQEIQGQIDCGRTVLLPHAVSHRNAALPLRPEQPHRLLPTSPTLLANSLTPPPAA
jgi:hypothetical protein